MKTLRKPIVLVLSAILLLSCNASPKLTNHDRGLFKVEKLFDDGLEKAIIDAKVSVIPPQKTTPLPMPKAKGFLDMSETIQKDYLKVLHAMIPNDPDKLIEYLKKPISDAPKSDPIALPVDYTRIKARFLLSNMKRFYKYDEHYLEQIASKMLNRRAFTMLHPNTRLEYLNTSLEIAKADQAYLQILSLDRLENEFEVIDLGTLKRNQELTFNSKITGSYGNDLTNSSKDSSSNSSTSGVGSTTRNVYDEFGNLIGTTTFPSGDSNIRDFNNENSKIDLLKLGANAEASINNKETIDEALNLKFRRLKSGVSFGKFELAVGQRGGNLRDISDNVVVTAFLKYSKPKTTSIYNVANLFNGVVANPSSKLTIGKRNIEYIPCGKASINANVTVDGVIRQVMNQRRGRNGFEYDDKVTYQLFDYTATDVEIALEPYCKREYGINATFQDGSSSFLQVQLINAEDLVLFESDNYLEVFLWVKAQIDLIKATPNNSNVDKTILQTNMFKLQFEYPQNNITMLVNTTISDTDLDRLRKITTLKIEER